LTYYLFSLFFSSHDLAAAKRKMRKEDEVEEDDRWSGGRGGKSCQHWALEMGKPPSPYFYALASLFQPLTRLTIRVGFSPLTGLDKENKILLFLGYCILTLILNLNCDITLTFLHIAFLPLLFENEALVCPYS
jgi:hypothetical protein